MISEHHVAAFGWASRGEMSQMHDLSLKTNTVLRGIFDEVGLELVDFKLSLVVLTVKLFWAMNLVPMYCRLWDKTTGKKMDKDRFREKLDGVLEAYCEVAERLGIVFDH